MPQPFDLRTALFEERRAFLRRQAGVGQQRFQITLNRGHGGLQLVVDVVGELFLDTDLLLLLVQRQGMFPVAVGRRALQAGVEADDVVRDVAQLVVGEGLPLVDPLAPLGALGKFVQACDVVPQAAGREVSRNAHQQRDAQHEPQEFPVGREYFAQRNGVGNGRADDDPVALHGRIEIVSVGAFRVAVDGVTGVMGERLGDFGAPEVVGCGQRVGRVVEQDAPVVVDDRYAQVAIRKGMIGEECPGCGALAERVEQPQVEELQPGIEPLGLETLFAAVLEGDEAGHQRPRKGEQQQEQPPVVGKPTPQNRSHSPGVLRCVPHKGRSCGAGA